MAPKFKMAKTFDEYTTEKLDIVQNKLLGDYNANGIYVINKKISAELLDLKKIKKESYNNEIFCTSVTTSGRIVDFEIEFKKNSASKLAVAELSVLEGVPKQGGRMMNIIKTPIGKFTGEITPDFVDRALSKFKVIINASDEGQDRKDVDDEYIVKRNMLLNYLDQMTQESYNIIYEDYFTQRINLLKQVNNSYSKKVLAIFNDEFNKIFDYFLLDKKTKKVTNYKAMNELLDKAFEDLSGLSEYEEQEKMFREKMLPILGIFVAGAERIDSSSKKTVLETVPKRFKEILTEPLLDKKQMEESRIPPTVKETNQEIINKEIKTAMEKIGDRSKKLSGEERTETATPTPERRVSERENGFKMSSSAHVKEVEQKEQPTPKREKELSDEGKSSEQVAGKGMSLVDEIVIKKQAQTGQTPQESHYNNYLGQKNNKYQNNINPKKDKYFEDINKMAAQQRIFKKPYENEENYQKKLVSPSQGGKGMGGAPLQ